MILPRFDLLEPESVQEICQALQANGNSKVIAGGTDLLVNLKKKVFSADTLVSLGKIGELKEMSYSDEAGLTLGSAVRIIDVVDSPVVQQNYPGLSSAAGKLGSWQIRNRATIGGNVCSARPAADTIGPLIAYGAVANIAGPNGMRTEDLETMYKGPGQTTLAANEILQSISIKKPAAGTAVAYEKYGIRQAMEIALVSITTSVTIENKTVTDARIVMGAVAPTYIRCMKTEGFLKGKEITEAVAEEAGGIASQTCTPITDIRASADYRRQLVRVLVKRNLLKSVAGN
ncbi:MAG: xanthine dehydrogenase family protein subunit M [Dehalococcoidales bacterium]|nr:xanthine dehydrogenase family protein subunit M [Dehalococcoidales bacterium]